MPEGPEVAAMINFLNKNYKDCILEKVEILSGRYKIGKDVGKVKKSKLINLLYSVSGDLPLKIISFNCYGKFIYWELEDDWYMFVTLGLKGRISVGDKEKYNRVRFVTSCGNLYMRDMLSNGTINFYKGKKEVDNKIRKMGIDLLNTDLSNKDIAKYFRERFNKKRKKDEYIADVLLDQKFFSGVGNYIRADGLYCAKMSPFRKVLDIKDDELIKLIKCLRGIMKNSYEIQTKSCKKKYVYENVAICYIPLVYFREFTVKNEKVENTKMKFQNRTIWYVPEVQI
jgi:formamidopyrimidine-DNA glycosylase